MERKKTFWSENAIKSLDSLGFSGLGRVIGNKDLFFLGLRFILMQFHIGITNLSKVSNYFIGDGFV